MKKIYGGLFICFLLFSLFQFNCAEEPENKEMSKEEKIAKGKYLVNVGGCQDCHTPKVFGPNGMEFDTTRLLAGHPQEMMIAEIDTNVARPGKWILTNDHLTAWVGPWGISYAANITPDNATGIGTLSEELFFKTIREGKWMGVGRPLLPPMPWQNYALMTDEDLSAIYAYLMSIKPLNNKVPDPMMKGNMQAAVMK